MRAIVLNETEIKVAQQLSITDEGHHHLKVVRCKISERILLLLGEGLVAEAEVLQVNKTQTQIEVLSIDQKNRPYEIEVCIGLIKKEAIEEVARLSTELGVKQVTPLLTRYSQRPTNQFKRWEKIVEQAQQQSNNPHRPALSEPAELGHFLENNHDKLIPSFLLSSRSHNVSLARTNSNERKACLFIGPEGGFTREEEEMVINTAGAMRVHLPTPILRAPTAVATGVGHILSSLKFV